LTDRYPTSFEAVPVWARQHGISRAEARVRFAQYAILRAIASSASLREMLVFKGGNALDFVWLPNRSTRDLDFSAETALIPADWGVSAIKRLLVQALAVPGRELDIAFAVHRVEQQPAGANKTFVTYLANIQYALRDEPALRVRVQSGEPIPQVIPIEVSLNEPICGSTFVPIDHSHQVRVCSIEDIVAEKLRALLQQPIRNRRRPQDVLDIAILVEASPGIDLVRVADYLTRKAAARQVPVSRAAFRAEAVRERARHGYAELEATTRTRFLPFDDALIVLDRLVDALPIPDE